MRHACRRANRPLAQTADRVPASHYY